MQRRKKQPQKRVYVQSGVPAHRTPGGRKGSKTRDIIQFVIIAAVVLILAVLGIYGISSLVSNTSSPTRINARLSDNIQGFGEDILYYDGATLHCVSHSGSVKWRFTLGMDADYTTSGSLIVAWAGNQLYVINKDGRSTYNDRMGGPIRFARVNDSYIVACIGEDPLNCTVYVLSHNGAILENNQVTNQYIIDIGFFTSRYMWVLGLDIDSSSPISVLSAYEPGRMLTGGIELSSMVYHIYMHNNLMMVTDASTIRAFNYKCVEQTDPSAMMVYGWQINDVRAVGRNTHVLLEPAPGSGTGEGITYSELRLITNTTTHSLRLLTPCFASGLGDKGVYGFGSSVIYYAPYGSKTFTATHLTYTISDFICMLDGGRAVVASGDEVYVLKLPT